MISVIVPTFNREKLLGICVKSLLSQEYERDFEIIIIDDGSTDKTRKKVNSFKNRKIRFFRQENRGPGAARNLGINKARGKYIAFIDDDCKADKKWLKNLSVEFDKGEVSVGGTIINATNKYVAWAQYILNFSSWFPNRKREYVKDIPTANIAYDKKTIGNLRFPEHNRNIHYEDSLFNNSLNQKILFSPRVIVYHLTWELNYGLKKFFMIQQNIAHGFFKYGPIVHGRAGKVLCKMPFLNLLCPRLIFVFCRCIKYKYFFRFLFCFPLIYMGEFYKGLVICKISK